MKRLYALIIAAAGAINLSAAPADTKADTLEYTSKSAFQQDLTANKIKPDTFYWANQLLDQALVPVVKMDGDTPCLEITAGNGTRKSSWQNAFLYRMVEVPSGKTSVDVAIDINYNADLWAPAAPALNAKPFVDVSFTDGTRVSAGLPLPLPKKPNTWEPLRATFPIPPGAKAIVVRLEVPLSYVARIRNINVALK